MRSPRKSPFCSGRSMVEILAVIVIAAVLILGILYFIGYCIAKSKANEIQKIANSRAAAIMTSPALKKTHEGEHLEALGFSPKQNGQEWDAYRKNSVSFAVTVTPVSKRVCEIIKTMDWSFLVEMYLNEVSVEKEVACAQNGNSFAFVYGTGHVRTEETPDGCGEMETPCDGRCCLPGQDCCAGECLVPCSGNGMTGLRDAFGCECLCNEDRGFARLAQGVTCICKDNWVFRKGDMSVCVECNEDSDCLGYCQQCVNEVCTPAHCCQENEEVCGDACCTSDEMCCNNNCYALCQEIGMTGKRNENCICECNTAKGFASPAVNGVCECQSGLVKTPDKTACVQCNTDADCSGECEVCQDNLCVLGKCCIDDGEVCTKEDLCCSGELCNRSGFCCPKPPTEADCTAQNKVRKADEKGCFSCMDKPITYKGKNDIDTDELIFVTFTVSGKKLTMTYLDTGPGGGRKGKGRPHNNTNDAHKSHVLKEVIIPDNYYFDESSFKGKSYGRGCDNIDFSGTELSVVYCTAGSVQVPTVEWEFTLYPNGWKD